MKFLRAFLAAVAALACSDSPPDLILTEVAMTDAIQHLHGFATDPSHWAFATADLLIGSLLQRLDKAGRLDDYVVAVCSDHGHAQMDTALYPGAILPDHLWEAEGATLHVVARSTAERQEAAERLALFGVTELHSAHVPEPHRDQIATFVAPDRHSFEEKPAGLAEEQTMGPPKYVSTHGLRPGDPADDRAPTPNSFRRGDHEHARTDGKYGMLLYLLCRCLQTKKPMWRTWMNLLNQTIDRINSLEAIEAPPEGELNLIDVFLARYDKLKK